MFWARKPLVAGDNSSIRRCHSTSELPSATPPGAQGRRTKSMSREEPLFVVANFFRLLNEQEGFILQYLLDNAATESTLLGGSLMKIIYDCDKRQAEEVMKSVISKVVRSYYGSQ